jgi:methyl-accepting chemotaxis protein/HPt (histidine-containing phosphotransfer) domain-containing protein/two-component sensor histidine kinase
MTRNHTHPVSRRFKSLRGKFVRVLLAVSLLMAIATTSIVALMSAQASAQHLAAVQGHIQDGIISKGKVLTQQHALALRSLALDNAFLDMQHLVERAVKDDPDLVYGLFVNRGGVTLAKSQRGDAVDQGQPPEQEGWRQLGLRQDELVVKAPTVRRVTRLGRDLVEVAVQVASEEGEQLGTIRYALSTERMHQALAQAKQASDGRLWRSVLLMVVLVSAVTGLGLVHSRAQAVHITEPVGALQRAAEALAHGDRSVRVDIKSDDELALLGVSFNRMVDELDGSYRELERMNHTLEQQVEARTAELALKIRDMRLVLDNVDQGFINLSARGVMTGERSAIVSEWFGASEHTHPFWQYVGRVSPAFGELFREAWSQVEDGLLPLEVSVSQLPMELSLGQRTWSLRYLPFHGARGAEDLEGMLVVIAEVTERLAREREEAEHGELMQGFKRLLEDRNGFSSFLQEAGTMVQQVVSPSAAMDLVGLKRTLHTLKGNASVTGFNVVAQLCHALEAELAETAAMNPRTLAQLRTRWAAIANHVTSFMGLRRTRVIEVPELEYNALIARLSAGDRHSELLKQVLSWQLEPASMPLSRLAEQAKSLARRLGRGEIEVDVSADDVRLDMQHWSPFFSELVHLVRNAVDHGLEPATERLTLGKPANGNLVFRASVEGEQLTFEVRDDGRGIDWAAIVDRAKSQGLPHSSHAELLDALCADGITTCSNASEISGRGVGMAALRRRVDDLSGHLEVSSAAGVGTSWFMRFDWPVMRQLEAAS